jgi:hypothetical protein
MVQVYVIQVCRQLLSRTRMVLLKSCLQTRVVLLESYLQTRMTCTIAECTVNKLLMMDSVTVQNM